MRQYQPSDLNEVTDAAFDAVPWAFASSLPFAMGLSWGIVAYLNQRFDGPMGVWPWVGFAAGTAIAAPFWWRWIKAIRTCNKFTRQMRAIASRKHPQQQS